MIKPRLLDLFCGGGGAAMGYYRAGFDVTGVDITPQPKYPFDFIQHDALDYAQAKGYLFDVIHASPPCQAYSTITPDQSKHKDLIADTRNLIAGLTRGYVIENVPGAPLIQPYVMLCGTMFDLLIERHRHFECFPPILFAPRPCWHVRKVVKHGRKPDRDRHYAAVTGHFSDVEFAKQAMGIHWLGQKGLAQAIPPAYTQWIGNQILKAIS